MRKIAYQNSVLDFIFSFALIGIVLMVFNSDGFEMYEWMESYGVVVPKRLIQIVIAIPIGVAFVYSVLIKPISLFQPVIIYLYIKLIIELVTNMELPFILDTTITIMALLILYNSPLKYFRKALKTLIYASVLFAFLALIKILITFVLPFLINNEVLSILGNSTEVLSIGPLNFARSSSFATEPSLNVLFFMIPAVISIVYFKSIWNKKVQIILLFLVLSFSGSVILALIISIITYIILYRNLLPLWVVYPTSVFIILGLYLSIIGSIETSNFADNFDFSQTNEAFDKSKSFEIRAIFGAVNFNTLLNNPLGIGYGSEQVINIPNPVLISVGLSGGWVSILLYTIFLFRLSFYMNRMRKNYLQINSIKIALSLMTGCLFVFIVFNDYLLINYSGMVYMVIVELVFKYYSFDRRKIYNG